jgi:hypothetical protein
METDSDPICAIHPICDIVLLITLATLPSLAVSSYQTELQERFPDHVVNQWRGHPAKVAEKQFRQVTEEHWGAVWSLVPPPVPHYYAARAPQEKS